MAISVSVLTWQYQILISHNSSSPWQRTSVSDKRMHRGRGACSVCSRWYQSGFVQRRWCSWKAHLPDPQLCGRKRLSYGQQRGRDRRSALLHYNSRNIAGWMMNGRQESGADSEGARRRSQQSLKCVRVRKVQLAGMWKQMKETCLQARWSTILLAMQLGGISSSSGITCDSC